MGAQTNHVLSFWFMRLAVFHSRPRAKKSHRSSGQIGHLGKSSIKKCMPWSKFNCDVKVANSTLSAVNIHKRRILRPVFFFYNLGCAFVWSLWIGDPANVCFVLLRVAWANTTRAFILLMALPLALFAASTNSQPFFWHMQNVSSPKEQTLSLLRSPSGSNFRQSFFRSLEEHK